MRLSNGCWTTLSAQDCTCLLSWSQIIDMDRINSFVQAKLPDLVACSESDPLWNRSVLLGLLGQDPLDLEGLL